MPLSEMAVRNAKPQSRQYKLYDAGGLFLIVTPSGGKWWRFKYCFQGKEKTLSLGTYPATKLKEAREKRDELKKQLAAGVDPGAHRKALKQTAIAEAENCFEAIALEWYAKQKPFGRNLTP